MTERQKPEAEEKWPAMTIGHFTSLCIPSDTLARRILHIADLCNCATVGELNALTTSEMNVPMVGRKTQCEIRRAIWQLRFRETGKT